MKNPAKFNEQGSKQLHRYLDELRSEVTAARRQLDEKEAYIKLVEESSNGLRRAYRDFQTLYRITERLAALRQQDQLMAEFFNGVKEILPLAAGAYLKFDKLAGTFSLFEEYELSAEYREEIRDHQNYSYYKWVMREMRPIVLPELVRSDPRHGSLSCLMLPIFMGDQLMGIADLFFRKSPEVYTQRDFDMLNILGKHAAVSLENAQLYEAMALRGEALASMKNFMKNVLESMSSGIIALDMEGRVSLLNKVAEKMLNIEDVDPVGMELLDLLSSGCGAEIYEMFRRSLDHPGEHKHEVELKTAEGRELPIGVTCSQLIDDNDKVSGVIIVLRDLTESHELTKLRKVDALKDQLISNISHELRTPLTAIKSFSEILLNYEEEDEATQREFLTIINSESDRLTRLINNILDLSKLESGMAQWELEPLNLKTVIDTAVDSVQSLLRQRNIEIVREYPEALPPVFADRDKLTQVVINLLSNAIKFSDDNEKIRLSIERVLAPKSSKQVLLRVGVHDHGPGIARENLSTIFDKFSQVTTHSDASKPKGTGLGLAISREIITHLGGAIWAESTPGQGASMYFELPAIPEGEQAVDEIYASEPVAVVEDAPAQISEDKSVEHE